MSENERLARALLGAILSIIDMGVHCSWDADTIETMLNYAAETGSHELGIDLSSSSQIMRLKEEFGNLIAINQDGEQ